MNENESLFLRFLVTKGESIESDLTNLIKLVINYIKKYSSKYEKN